MNDPGRLVDSPARGDRPEISIVVPALDERAAIEALCDGLARQPGDPRFEILLADGGSRDGTVERFLERARLVWPDGRARVVRCRARGRARQMNAGAAAARGDLLLFLHADTILPEGALARVRATIAAGASGGGFGLRFDAPDPGLALIACWATLRSRLAGVHYGDQAPFVRRDLFERLGGFPDVPLFEDHRFAIRLRRAGRVRTLMPPVVTSARRFREGGVARTAARFAWLRLRHALGADPRDLARDYDDVR